MNHDQSTNGSEEQEGPLPPGWSRASLDQITVERVDQGRPSGDGTFSYIDISSIDNERKVIRESKSLPISQAPSRARQHAEPGDVLVSMTRPNLNAVAMVPESLAGAVCSTGFHVLRAIGVDSRWLFAAVQAPEFVSAMAGLVQGALYPAVRPHDVRRYEIPIPPLAEQRRIVAEIETQFTRLDAAVAALERARANLKRYRAAVLEEAVAKGSAESSPSGSSIETLGKLATRSEYGTSVKCSYEATNEPVLRIPNVARGQIDLSDMKYATRPLALQPESALGPGDLLMVRTNGSIDLVGRTAVVVQPMPKLYGFASYLLRFRFDPARVSAAWIHLYLSSPRGREFIERHAASSAGQHNVSLSLLGKMPIPLPSIGTQQAIMLEVERRMSIVEDVENSIIANLKRAEHLRQTVLRNAFAGQLVPQDPTDEPASVLLDRLRTERAAAPRRRSRSVDRKTPSQPLLC